MQTDLMIAWLKEWQPLLGGGLAVLAALIFAIGSVAAARIRAGAAARNAHPDLRADAGPVSVSGPVHFPEPQISQPADLVRNLEQLRTLVRSALSALTPSDKFTNLSAGASQQIYDGILRLRLEACGLPAEASQSAQDLLLSLNQHIEALRHQTAKKAAASDIANILIKVNTVARNLLSLLAPTSAAENAPSNLKQG